VAVTALAVAACSGAASGGTSAASGGGSSAAGVTATTVTIGYLASETGAAASSYVGTEKAVEAAFDYQNAKGGVDGRKLKLIVADDGSTAAGNLHAAQSLVSDGVFGIIDTSPYDYGGDQYLHQQGVPVTGSCCSGTPWGMYDNMFAWEGGESSNSGPQPVNFEVTAAFLKSMGVTSVAGFAYVDNPGSQTSIEGLKEALQQVGLKMGYENLSLPFGSSNFTTEALAMKSAGVNGADCECVQSSNIGMMEAIKQAGLPIKAEVSAAGVDDSVFNNADSEAAAQGTYWPLFTVPANYNAASTTFLTTLKAHGVTYAGNYPSFGQTLAYVNALLMMEGLQVAGKNPTRGSFITNLQKVTSWDAGGLLPAPLSFNHLGTPDQHQCSYYTVVRGNQFVPINNDKPYCN
jgi:branched-chain amino acid transport system substrate-binding protein